MSILTSFINALPAAVAQGIIWGIMAIGVYITYRILDVADLTVDGTLSTGGAVLVVCVTSGMNIYLALVVAFLAGCVAGFATGIFHTVFGIPAILSGILTQLALYSVNLRIQSKKANLPISINNYNLVVTSRYINKSLIIELIFVVALIAVLYWFFGTEKGHSLRATGSNSRMAQANGININTNKVLGLVISNGIVAFAGGLLALFNGSTDVNMGRGAIVIGLAAVIIGEVVFGKIFKNFALKLVAVVLGGIIYYVVMRFVLCIGLDANDLKLFIAIVVALFLGVPYWKNNIAQKRVKNKEVKE